MSCAQRRGDLGAFVVGALRGQEAEDFRRHLRTCASCRAEAEELGSLPQLLAAVDEAEVVDGPPRPSPRLLSDLLRRVAAERAARRRRARLAGVAAAVVAVAAAVLAFSVLAGGGGSGDPGPAVPEPPSRMVTAADASTGVRAEIDVRTVGWGSDLTLRLRGVSEGQRCSLVAVGRDGTRETAATWAVPEGGYGASRQLTVGGAVGLQLDDVERFEVVTTTGRTLVRVPA